ncbi:hypothetical protein [Gulosibacter sediminis]|nr:hypothetical protein [Gulosibacter sediminis]
MRAYRRAIMAIAHDAMTTPAKPSDGTKSASNTSAAKVSAQAP